jgi:hypothetical protein
MTTGALIFAYENEAFDYVRMAAWAAANVQRHLDIPVALVTDQPTDRSFDRVIIHNRAATDTRWFEDVQQLASWNNSTRPDAFDLTPWDRTLLIDADYVVASDRLKTILDTAGDIFACHNRAQDATGLNNFVALNRLGAYDWPLCWATVMVFDRTRHARAVFDSMKMIRDRWPHYQKIYRDRSRTFRNDHALTIALNMASGHTGYHGAIPWCLTTVMPEHELSKIDQDHYRLTYHKPDNRRAWLEIKDQDFHAMGKRSLMSMIT